MKIAFRIDISDKIGTGHFVRMSALADAFINLGHTCEFFKGEDEPVDYSGFNIIIIDTYLVDDEYIAKLNSPGRTLVCYDDNSLYTYNCDVLINANLHAGELEFKFSGKRPCMLLGGKYSLLRREFREACPIEITKAANRVFICFGGSDLRNMTPRVIEELQGIDDIYLSVVLGGYTNCDSKVFGMAKENITVYKTPESMAEIMKNCDIAITAAGSMIYELACLGIPSIIISQAENQFLIAEYMKKTGLVTSAGDWKNVDFKFLKKETKSLLNNISRRKIISKKLKEAVDKNGAMNVAKAIIDLKIKS